MQTKSEITLKYEYLDSGKYDLKSHPNHNIFLRFRSNQEMIEEAFLPTLKTIVSAPLSSPLAEVNPDNVAELLVQLTNSKLLLENQKSEEQTTVCIKIKHNCIIIIKSTNNILKCKLNQND